MYGIQIIGVSIKLGAYHCLHQVRGHFMGELVELTINEVLQRLKQVRFRKPIVFIGLT